MKRAAIERNLARAVWRKHWDQHVRQNVQSGGKTGIECKCDLQVNRFRKGQNSFGCGKPRCFTCHGEKLLGIPKHRDVRRALVELDL